MGPGEGAGRRAGRVLVVTGPSGSGKNTLVEAFASHRPDVWFSVSVTTRPPRPDEVAGAAYDFVDDVTFDELVADGTLLEWATYAGHRYGTPAAPLLRRVRAGVDVVVIAELDGAATIRAAVPGTRVVFVAVPATVLAGRLAARDGTPMSSVTSSDRAARLAAAAGELAEGPKLADLVVDGTDPVSAVAAFDAVLRR